MRRALGVHGQAALLALTLVWFYVQFGLADVGFDARDHVDVLAPRNFYQRQEGVALQRAAVRTPDLLPLYGACDVTMALPMHPNAVFEDYPTGFDVFAVTRLGPTPCLNILANVAALGPDVRGRKIAIVLAHSHFDRLAGTPRPYDDDLAGNFRLYFSPVYAGSLLFESGLSQEVKRDYARRLLAHEGALADLPVLRFAAERLADDSPASTLLFRAVSPLGKVQNALSSFQDRWALRDFFRDRVLPAQQGVPRTPRPIPWPLLEQQAQEISERISSSNPVGFFDVLWKERLETQYAGLAGATDDATWLASLEASPEWEDFEIMLRGLRDLGVDALLVSTPMKGAYYDHVGVSERARRVYHEKFAALVRKHGLKHASLAEYDSDRYFLGDDSGILSPKGNLVLDQILDRFHRGALR